MTYVFDTSALLRFIDLEAGWEYVSQILTEAYAQSNVLLVSAVNWGELAGKIYKRTDLSTAKDILSRLQQRGLQVVEVSAESAIRAAILSARLKVSYADAFGIELASARDHITVTADFGVRPALGEVTIQFLAAKP